MFSAASSPNLHSPDNRFHIQQLSSQSSIQTLEQDVRAGLLTAPRSLPPKYFYDDEGSRLFNAICETEEYYPARTEFALLTRHAEEIIEIAQPQTCIELGAGASTKTEILLSGLSTNDGLHTYVTIDVCREILVESAYRLLKTYPNLRIRSVVGDYLPAMRALPALDGPVLYIFIGSSIGNFTEQEAIALLAEVAQRMGPDDHFLVGFDRVKDRHILEKAYNDLAGITSKFNLNVLKVLNNKLHTDFNLEQFYHQAIYNEKDEQIEMYLVSKQPQTVCFSALNKTIYLQKNERILTEISCKYTKSSIRQLLANSGLAEQAHFEPANEYFSLILAKRAR